MITKIYEVSCDNCLTVINHYMGNRPTIDEMRKDGAILKGNKQLCCKKCCDKYEHR